MPPKTSPDKHPLDEVEVASSPKRTHPEEPTKTNPLILQRRREGRARAQEKLQNKLEEMGVHRADSENHFAFSTFPVIQLINQKNYYTDYLKKDDQFRMIRQMKERVLEARLAKKRKQAAEKAKSQDILTNLKQSPSVASNMSSAANSSADEDDDDDDDDVEAKDKVIILQPGSENIRIGLVTDLAPTIVKNVVAYKADTTMDYSGVVDPATETDEDDGLLVIKDPEYAGIKKKITTNFKERMRYYKRRIEPKSHETCVSFNERAEPTVVPDENDIHQVTYLHVDDVKGNHVIGEDVFRLAEPNKWKIRSPFIGRGFNDKDLSYTTREELLGDVELILTETLSKSFQLSKKDLSSYSCIIVLPNMYEKSYVETMVAFLLNDMNFQNVAMIEEGLAATFGSGVSTGCVVDVGSSSTKVCCVEEGMIIPNSQVVLNYGSADITRLFIKNLLAQQFPYKQINLNDLDDWKLANELKHNHITFNDANVAVQAFSFVARKAGHPVLKYEFKCFDEVMISPMGLFYPQAFLDGLEDVEDRTHGGVIMGKLAPSREIREHGLFASSSGVFEGLENNDPQSLLQCMEIKGEYVSQKDVTEIAELIFQLVDEDSNSNNSGAGSHTVGDYGGRMGPNYKKFSADMDNTSSTQVSQRDNMMPLDEAIIESITMAGYNDAQRLETLYQNIALIGGGSNIENFETMVVDRLNIMRTPMLGSNKLEQVVSLLKGWREEWASEWKKKNKDSEPNLKEFELTKAQMQRVTNMVNNSQPVSIEILPPSEEDDPGAMCWKGGSVFAKLKIVEELWINIEDWDRLGSRALNYVSLFSY